MKKILLISLAFMIGLATIAQGPRVKDGVFVKNVKKAQIVTNEPATPSSIAPVKTKFSGLKNAGNTNIVTILDMGTSANVLGYSGGTRTMVWADNDLNTVINFHRMGPGATPPSFSGYLGMDIGVNMGATQADITPNVQCLAATLAASPYYYDASRYPSAAIYNPAGNKDLANAYLAYFAPNFANLELSGFGGYSYGTVNMVNYADSSKHLRWYDSNPPTYIPDGFTVSSAGVAYMLDGGTQVIDLSYIDSIVYGRGVWNAATTDFDYTLQTIPMPCVASYTATDNKIAAAPDGNTMWLSSLTNLPEASPLLDSSFAPVLRKSTDGGLTWGPNIPIQLDGPNGIATIKNTFSQYFINNFFAEPIPTRDEIPYTTAFDHSLTVDKWGNPHIGVVVGVAPGGWNISTGVDSCLNAYDIYSLDDGATWLAVHLGSISTFRGDWATYTSDNRMYASRTPEGDKLFFTWNDTKIEGVTDNQNPDVYARGFDLVNNKLTADEGGIAQPDNVTFLSDITTEAYFQCTSPTVFTANSKYTLPICTQWFVDGAGSSTFKYIPDFFYTDADFTVSVDNPPFPVGIDQKNNDLAAITVYPNPVKDVAKVSMNLKQNANVSVDLTNLVGQQILSLNKGYMTTGLQQFSIDASSLSSGVYFLTVRVNGQKFTQKLIVE